MSDHGRVRRRRARVGSWLQWRSLCGQEPREDKEESHRTGKERMSDDLIP